MHLITKGMPRCTCGHLLRTGTEQANGQCIECNIRAALIQASPKEQAAVPQPGVAQAIACAR